MASSNHRSGAWKYLAVISCTLLYFTGCTQTPVLPLGQEQIPQGETQKTADISQLLSGHLQEQYAGADKMLRDTHPKANACLRGKFTINSDIASEFQHGIFQPGAEYPVWMRFSNAVEELTDDHEDDFRGLAMKLTGIEGERLPLPGDEQHTQDFLFLGHDAFFAANPDQFFDFFDLTFKGRAWQYLLTHPKGTLNILQGTKTFKNPLSIEWNSVTPYALGKKEGDNYKTVVRYAVQSCAVNYGVIPPEPSPDYLADNLDKQLSKGTGCLDFFIQLQKDPIKNPIENALVAWDQQDSPFIKIARIDLPSQTFTSEAQKDFCENISFNPWHSLKAHRPLGGINRARRVVMKDISDLRLKTNGVERFEPTGYEIFE